VVFPLPVKNNLSLQNPENNVYFVRACVEHMQILAEMYMFVKSLAGSYLYPAQCKIHLSIILSSSSSSYYTTLFC